MADRNEQIARVLGLLRQTDMTGDRKQLAERIVTAINLDADTPAELNTTTIEYVFFEATPFVRRPTLDANGQLDERDELADECAMLPEAFRVALTDVLRNVDNMRCARCGDSVGYALVYRHGDDRLEWNPTGLAWHGDGPVAVLCDSCTPWLPDAELQDGAR